MPKANTLSRSNHFDPVTPENRKARCRNTANTRLANKDPELDGLNLTEAVARNYKRITSLLQKYSPRPANIPHGCRKVVISMRNGRNGDRTKLGAWYQHVRITFI